MGHRRLVPAVQEPRQGDRAGQGAADLQRVPAGDDVRRPAAWQITLAAVRDGFEMRGVVVKVAPRKILVVIDSRTIHSGERDRPTVPLTFEA